MATAAQSKSDDAVNLTANMTASDVLRKINLEIRVEDWFGVRDLFDITSPRFTVTGFSALLYIVHLIAKKKDATEFGGAIKGKNFYVYVYNPRQKFRNGICPVLQGKVTEAGRTSNVVAKIRMNPLLSFTLKFLILAGILLLGFCLYMSGVVDKKSLSPDDVQAMTLIFGLWFLGWPVAFWLIHNAFAQDRKALCKFLEDIVR